MTSPTAVPNDRIREQAERLATGPVTLAALSMAFEESSASSAEVLVEGRSFYPPMLEDIASASSSVHINQFGFRPGVVGDRFAEALVAKANEGIPVRLVVDRQGSDPERGSQAFYERLTAAGVEVCVVRATKPSRRGRPARKGRGDALEPSRARAHRPPQDRRRRRSHRLGWRRRDRGPLRGRPFPRPVRPGHGPGRPAACSSSSSAASAGSAGGIQVDDLETLFPETSDGAGRFPPSSCTTHRGATGRSPTRSRTCSRARGTRSTWSIPTSPTAA